MTSLPYWQAFTKEHRRLGTQIVSIPLGDLERLVEELFRFECAVCVHRGDKQFRGVPIDNADRRLWERIEYLERREIRGDG